MTLIDQAMAAVSSREVTGIVAVGDIYCRFLSACEHTCDVRRAEQWMSVVDHFVDWSHSLLVSTTCRLHYGGILMAIGRWAEAEQELIAALRLSETSYRAMRVFPLVRLAGGRTRSGSPDLTYLRRWAADAWAPYQMGAVVTCPARETDAWADR